MLDNRRFVIIAFFGFIGLAYVLRLFHLQVLDDTYSIESSANSIKRIAEMPFRGQIYDRNGKLMVYNTPVYDLLVTPYKAKVQDTLQLCRLLNIEQSTFDSLMTAAATYSRNKPSMFIRQLSREDFARIQDIMVDYPGFEFAKSSMRTYTAPTMANSLGYVSEITGGQLKKQEDYYYQQGDYYGQSGLESFYEKDLRGRRGVKFVMQNVNGVVKGSWKDGELDTMAVAGKNLYTGIDIALQHFADSLMVNKVGSVVAIEPSTGQILTIVSAPNYDPNKLASRHFSENYRELAENPYKPLFNRPVMASYRPGSTFKVIQALAALQQGAIRPGTAFSHAGVPMKCHGGGHGGSVPQAVQHSCNPYFYRVFQSMLYNNDLSNTYEASRAGLAKWHEQVSKFGIGQRLGVDLPSEYKGSLPDVEYYDKVYGKKRWKFSNVYSLSIGEGELLITPVKMANVAAIIANRGYYYTPHIVSGVGKKNNPLPEYLVKHDVGIERKHFDTVIPGMVGAVDAGTVIRLAKIADVQIAGKTGTSQNKRGRDHSIFIAFAPADNPKIAIAAFVENGKWGGSAAAPVANLIVERYLKGRTENTRLLDYTLNLNCIQYTVFPETRKPVVKDTVKKKKIEVPLAEKKAKPSSVAKATASAGE